MAISKQVEVCVTSNNVPLPEYDVPPDEVNPKDYSHWSNVPQLHKYLECVPNTNFTVAFKALPAFRFEKSDYIQADVYVDGKLIDQALRRKAIQYQPTSWNISEGQRANDDGVATIRKYKFTELQLDDGKSTHREYERSRAVAIGTIRVVIERRKYVKDVSTPFRTFHREIRPDKPSEKDIKGCGKDTVAELDVILPDIKRDYVVTEAFDKKPFAIFVFHYFSRDGLQKIGVIPRPPSPTPPEQKAINDLTLEEARALLQRRQADEADQEELAKHLKSQLAKAKKELQLARKRDREDTEDKGEGKGEGEGEGDDDEVQVVKKPKMSAKIEIIELDD